MTGQSNKKKTGLIIALGSAGSVVLGWVFNKYGKDRVKDMYTEMNQKVKDTTDKWYADGEERAQEFESIKTNIKTKL